MPEIRKPELEEAVTSNRPIFIVGCPRSGTRLVARILGSCSGHFLITEHFNKMKSCPEDRSGVDDASIWWANFDFEGWDRESRRPPVETPIYNKEYIMEMKSIYLALTKRKRLIVKNPSHLCRIPILREMFPDALFVFCLRNPWHTLQSMTIKGNESFLLRTPNNAILPNDLLLKAAVSWQEAIDICLREKDHNWITVKYEDLVASPTETISELFRFLDIRDQACLEKVCLLPKPKTHTYTAVERLFRRSKFQVEIMEAIEQGNRCFSYPLQINSSIAGSRRGFFSKYFVKAPKP